MKQNGKKRQSPSVERQLALALIALLEAISDDAETPGFETLTDVVLEATKVLRVAGYEGLESIPTRVKRIENEIAEALKAQDGAKLGQLGAALDRAKKGLPPLATEKKTAQTPKTRKARKKKGEADDAVLNDDKQHSPADAGTEEAWLTRHPEPGR